MGEIHEPWRQLDTVQMELDLQPPLHRCRLSRVSVAKMPEEKRRTIDPCQGQRPHRNLPHPDEFHGQRERSPCRTRINRRLRSNGRQAIAARILRPVRHASRPFAIQRVRLTGRLRH